MFDAKVGYLPGLSILYSHSAGHSGDLIFYIAKEMALAIRYICNCVLLLWPIFYFYLFWKIYLQKIKADSTTEVQNKSHQKRRNLPNIYTLLGKESISAGAGRRR